MSYNKYELPDVFLARLSLPGSSIHTNSAIC